MSDGYFILPFSARRGTCASCGQSIAWITMQSGAQMPLDVQAAVQRDGATYALNHFATCPQGRAWSAQKQAVAVKACPNCGRDLLERTNSKNGSTFLGCSGYPDCTHSEGIPESLKLRRAGQVGMFDEDGV